MKPLSYARQRHAIAILRRRERAAASAISALFTPR